MSATAGTAALPRSSTSLVALTTSQTSGPRATAARRTLGPSLNTIPACWAILSPWSTSRSARPEGVAPGSARARRRNLSRIFGSKRIDRGTLM